MVRFSTFQQQVLHDMMQFTVYKFESSDRARADSWSNCCKSTVIGRCSGRRVVVTATALVATGAWSVLVLLLMNVVHSR
jgi:hypothetical protein